jgi:alkanesulfonate monooxygenase SsuD/methylene tetrahydromethanopterin reductase-like flavin-dependent oxidoreductase (luciferase family)
LGAGVIGGPETVQRELKQFLRETQADELIFTSDLYDFPMRLRSFEIAAEAMKALAASQMQPA